MARLLANVTTTTFGAGQVLHDVVSGAAKGLGYDLEHFWPLLVVALALLAVVGSLKARQRRRLALSGIAEVDKMDGQTFEHYLREVFSRLGYGVELTPYVGDYGADLIVSRAGVRCAVQAKRSGRPVGIKAVQEAAGARDYYRCQEAIVVTNTTFTAAARRLASATGVELWDRPVLVGRALEVRRQLGSGSGATTEPVTAASELAASVSPAPLAVGPRPAAPGANTVAPAVDQGRCATCGKTVTAAQRDYCLDRQARFGGKVYCFRHQRQAH